MHTTNIDTFTRLSVCEVDLGGISPWCICPLQQVRQGGIDLSSLSLLSFSCFRCLSVSLSLFLSHLSLSVQVESCPVTLIRSELDGHWAQHAGENCLC